MCYGLTSGKKTCIRRLPIIRNANVDLERPVNKLNKLFVLNTYAKILLGILFLGGIFQVNAQDRIPFDQGTQYILADVDVTGKISFNKQTVVTFAGLEKGQTITVPGEEIS